MLAANFALTLYISQPRFYEDTVRQVYSDYLKKTSQYDEYYAELEEILHTAFKDDPVLPHSFSGDSGIDDYMILRFVRERDEYFDGFAPAIKKIIRQTETHISDLRSYGYSDNTYTIGSQIALKERYERLLDEVVLENEYTRGYDTYLNNQIVTAFILLFITAAVSYIFLQESTAGFCSVMQATKRGQLPSASAKIVISLLVCIASALVFLASTFLAVGLSEGYSSIFSPIQNFADFLTVPDAMTVLEYLLLQIGLRLGGFTVFTMFIALLASSRLPYAVCFAGGAAFAGINCLLFYRTYMGTVPAIRYLNFAAMTDGRVLTGFFRTVSIFKIPVRDSTVMVAVSIMLCIVLGGITALSFCKRSGSRRRVSSRLGAFISFICKQKSAIIIGIKQTCTHHRFTLRWLWMYELCKIRPCLIILLILLLLAGRVVYVDAAAGDMQSYSEALYYNYISEVQRLNLGERTVYLASERERIDTLTGSYTHITEDYAAGNITYDEYSNYLNKYYRALSEDPVFNRVENYVGYIDRKNAQTGLDGDIIYSTGYERLFGLSPDLFLYSALIILCFRAFSVEYTGTSSSGGFEQILRTTKNGRKSTFAAKFIIYLISGGLLAVVFRMASILTVARNCTLLNTNATLFSVQSFSSVSSGITIWQYLAVDMLMQMFAAFILATVIVLMSFLMKNNFAILTITLLITGIPELIVSTVLTSSPAISILSLTSPQDIVCRSAELRLLSFEIGYIILVCLFWLAIATILFVFAYYHYNNQCFIKKNCFIVK